ncbi:MAG TPA: hypothetical protein DCO75_12565, partial [Fibrobacteres bacterium]|nr:hypothetical protein [Fibrobacterota bacterium]
WLHIEKSTENGGFKKRFPKKSSGQINADRSVIFSRIRRSNFGGLVGHFEADQSISGLIT